MKSNMQLMPAGLILAFLGLMFGAILFFPSMGLNPALAGLVVIGLAIAAPLIAHPRYLFWFYFVWVFVLRCSQVIFPLSRYGDELLIMLWCVVLLGMLAFKQTVVKDSSFAKLFGGLILISLISWLVNGSNTKKMIIFSLSYLFPLVTFFLARNFLNKDRDLAVFVRVVIGIFFLQLVLNIGWVLRINPIPNRWLYTHDFAIGSFNSQTYVAYFCCFILFTLIGVFIHYKSSKVRFGSSVLFALVFIQLVMTFTLHAYLFLVLGVVLYVVLFSGKKAWVIVPSGLLAIFIGGLLLLSLSESFISESGATQKVREELRLDNLVYRYNKMILGPKGQCYADAFYHAPSESPVRWIVGAGPGDFISTVAMYQTPHSALTMRYLGRYFLTFSGEQDRAGHSITQIVVSSPPVLMGELGLGGLLFYSALCVWIIGVVLKNIYTHRYSNRLQIVLAKGFVSSFGILFVISLLMDLLNVDFFIILFATLGALLVDPIGRDEIQQEV
ncbi:MAG: hypothetical protein V3V05_04385 [Pontiella sp.]